MRTATITMHGSHNCGSMLQAYALQKVLFSLGIDNEIINFRSNKQKYMYAFFRKPTNIHDILYDGMKVVYFKIFKTHFADYEDFLNNFLVITPKEYRFSDELESLEKTYDIFITGSDQVWNVLCDDASDAFYLDFVKHKKKVAYAPSFGVTNINKLTNISERYKNYINDMKYISIRENNGVRWIKELTGRDAPVVLDPTMLLNKNEYEILYNHRPIINKRYIFYYAFSYSENNSKIVKQISLILGIPVIVLDAKNWVKTCKKFGFQLSDHSGPITFLNLLFHAELVLTTSFHGTALSIIGHKKFWFIDSELRDEEDDRVTTLLNMLELDDRIVLGGELSQKENILEMWDINKTDNLLGYLKKRSIDYIIEALK